MTQYHSALSEIQSATEKKKYRSPAKGSFGHACLSYYASATFKALDADSTQKGYRTALDEIAAKHGNKPIALIEPRHIRRLLNEKHNTPGQAKYLLKALRGLFRFEIDQNIISDDPTVGIRAIRYTPNPHHGLHPVPKTPS
jgi:site-specific recombinase XerD